MSEPTTVVIVEDDYLISEDLRAMCEDLGARVLSVLHKADGAAEEILRLKPGFVLMDVRLGGKRDGVDVAQSLHDVSPEIKVVFVTGSNEPPTIQRIRADDPFRILIKPIGPDQLRDALLL